MIIPDTFLTVREELLLFFGAVLLGCGMELLFDIFRAVRLIIPHKAAAAAIEDIVFIVLWAGCIICFTTAFAKGDFRVFYIAGSILGFVLWRLLLGNPLVRLLSRILSAVLRLLKWIISPISKSLTLTTSFPIGSKITGFAFFIPSLKAIDAAILNAISDESTG